MISTGMRLIVRLLVIIETNNKTIKRVSGVPKGGFGVFTPPPQKNSEDIGGVLDRMSKKNRRLDFLL